MAKMSDHELKGILQAAYNDALSSDSGNELTSQRQKAMKYYLGDMKEDIPNIEGRSSAVSTDVSDTVEGLMPALMEIFFGGDEVVKFEPVGPEDTKAAEQETDYINHVFQQKNPGFLVLYSMIKDALLSKVGIAKVYWESYENEEKETYYDLDDMQLAMLIQDPNVEIVEHTIKSAPGDQEEQEEKEDAGAVPAQRY